MNNAADARAICPYYRKRRGCRISCEGVSGMRAAEFVFRSTRQAERYAARHCECQGWQTCLYAEKLNEEYGKQE